MILQPHQERVIEERDQLDKRIERLESFFGNLNFIHLPDAEQDRLQRQIKVMREYLEVLNERIAAF